VEPAQAQAPSAVEAAVEAFTVAVEAVVARHLEDLPTVVQAVVVDPLSQPILALSLVKLFSDSTPPTASSLRIPPLPSMPQVLAQVVPQETAQEEMVVWSFAINLYHLNKCPQISL
jgi:hypothetical protein